MRTAFDRFRVRRQVHDALDEVRRPEMRQAPDRQSRRSRRHQGRTAHTCCELRFSGASVILHLSRSKRLIRVGMLALDGGAKVLIGFGEYGSWDLHAPFLFRATLP